jgi:hypothetical protein
MMSMPLGLDARLAERIVGTAMRLLNPTPSDKILCTKSASEDAILMAQYLPPIRSATLPRSALSRPTW